MATNTTNYNWTKPDYEDDADIKDLNDNFDGIDAQVKAIDDQVQLNKNNIYWSQQKLAEIVDSGNKNLIPCDIPAGTYVSNILTITNNGDGTFTADTNGQALPSNAILPIATRPTSTLNGNIYVLSGCPNGGSTSTYYLSWEGGGTNVDSGDSATYEANSTLNRILFVGIAGAVLDNVTFAPMLCTEVDWHISDKFVPKT